MVERSGTRLRGCGEGKEWHQDAQVWIKKIVERCTRMRRCGGGKEIVDSSGTRMRRWRRRDSREEWHQNAQMWRRQRDSIKEWHQDSQMWKKERGSREEWGRFVKVRPHRTRSAAADCGLCPLRNVTF